MALRPGPRPVLRRIWYDRLEMAEAERLKLRYVKLDTVQRFGGNPKLHDLEALKESFRLYGFADPPKFDAELDAIVYGNGRAEALEEIRDAGEDPPRGVAVDRRNGAWSIPVVFGVDAESRAAAERFAVDHNTLTLAGGSFDLADAAQLFDTEGLAALTQGWGSNGEADFSGLVLDFGPEQDPDPGPDPPAPVPTSEEEAAALVAKWGTAAGQIWTIGRHRLMCGDSTKAEDVEALLDGAKPGILMADPPYGMNLDTDYTQMPNDKVKSKKYQRVHGDDGPFDYRSFAPTVAAKEQFWWGADYYCQDLPKGGSWIVWDKRVPTNDAAIGSGFELCWSVRPHKRRMLRLNWCGYTAHDPGERRSHPTQKPIALLVEVLTMAGNAPEVYDPFAGTGTAMIAADELDRTCYSMEIDPVYVAVTLERCEGRGLGPIALTEDP